MSDYLTRLEEIDRFYEENPEPTALQAAERLIPLAARRIVRLDCDGYHTEDLPEFTAMLHEMWIDEAITLRQAAQVAIPAVYDRLSEQERLPEMKAWMTACFFDCGLDREVAVEILRAHQGREEAS